MLIIRNLNLISVQSWTYLLLESGQAATHKVPVLKFDTSREIEGAQ